ALDLVRRMILEQLGVGPLHAPVGEQLLGGVPRAPEALEEEHGVGEVGADARDQVLPDMDGDLVARVAAESVHAAAAPCEQRVREEVPEGDMALFELDEVLPDDAPGAGAGEPAVGFTPEEFGVFLEEAGTPAGVVQDEVEERACAEGMHGAGEFGER